MTSIDDRVTALETKVTRINQVLNLDNPPPPSPINIVVNPIEINDLLQIPYCGYQTFYVAKDKDHQTPPEIPSSSLYARFNWSDLEPKRGQYNFSVIDQFVEEGKRTGQTLSTRVMTWNNDKGPTSYGDLAGVNESYGGGYRQPDLNNVSMRVALENLIRALASRYNDPAVMDHVDIGFYGPWGEWSEVQKLKTPLPSLDTCKWLVDKMLENFTSIKVIANVFMTQVNGAMEYALKNGCGWRGDSWGDFKTGNQQWSNQDNLYGPLVAGAGQYSWQKAPVCMETWGIFNTWLQNNKPFQRVFDWTVENHVNYVHNKSGAIPPLMLSPLKNMLGRIGYRFVPRQITRPAEVTLGAPFKVEVSLDNIGNCPPYFDTELSLNIENGDFVNKLASVNLKGMLPGNKQINIGVETLGGYKGLRQVFLRLKTGQRYVPMAVVGGQKGDFIIGNLRVL